MTEVQEWMAKCAELEVKNVKLRAKLLSERERCAMTAEFACLDLTPCSAIEATGIVRRTRLEIARLIREAQ